MADPILYRTPTRPRLLSRIKWRTLGLLRSCLGPRRGSPKIFCLGWEKTGTTTFGVCMQQLGYAHLGHAPYFSADVESGRLQPVMWEARFRQSFDDWPWYALYRELDVEFPGSRFVLTTRPSQPWVRSLLNHMANRPPPDAWMHRHKRLLYGFSFYDATEAQLIERYESHNQSVRRYFQHRPHDFLEVDWTRGDGWKELCGFLGLPAPAGPLPHANRGIYTT